MEICKSKQLLNKSKTPKNRRLPGRARTGITRIASSTPRSNRSESRSNISRPHFHGIINNNLPKFCSNSKPMPSLAELEKMYDGSDDDELPPLPHRSAPKPTAGASRQPLPPSVDPVCDQAGSSAVVPERSKTPDQPVVIDLEKLCSPCTVQNITRKMIDYIENLSDGTIQIPDGPPPPVIPPKKRKKTEVPFIVGCKERDQLKDWKSSAVTGAGDSKYGIEKNEEEDEKPTSPKRYKKSNIPMPQYSHFNAQSEEIASALKDLETLSDKSSDSAKTVTYEYLGFSPEPSTSNDDKVFLKNQMRLNESLKMESINDSTQSDVEIIEEPRVTIDIDDYISSNDSGVQLVDNEVKEVKPTTHTITTIDLLDDDPYKSISDIDLCNDSVCEVIDVDDVIANHASILNKFKRNTLNNEVILVEPTNNVSAFIPETSQPAISNISSSNEKAHSGKDTENPTTTIMDIVTNYFKQPGGDANANVYVDSAKENRLKELAASLSNVIKNLNIFAGSKTNIAPTLQNSNVTDGPVLQQNTSGRYQPNVAPNLPSTSAIETIPVSNARGRPKKNIQNAAATSGPIFPTTSAAGIPSPVQWPVANPRGRPRKKCSVNLPATSSPILPVNFGSMGIDRAGLNVAIPQLQPSPLLDSPQPPARRIGECPICMENLSNKSVASTVCGHIFCLECIKAAIKSGGKKCPTCRKKLTGVGYHQLFL